MPLDHEQSNFRLVSEIFLNRLLERNLISRNQILSVRTDISHPEIEYSSQTPRIDIGLFGVGPDGHIASLFPQHSGLHDTSGKYIKISDSPKPPSERISISVTMAKSIPFPYLFFMGTTKNEAYRYFMNLDTPMESCPAKYLFDNERCTVVTNLV